MFPPDAVQQVAQVSIARAYRDKDFRRHLKADPEQALGEVIHKLGLKPESPEEEAQLKSQVAREVGAVPALERAELADIIKTMMKDAQSAFYSTVALSKSLFWFGVVLITGTVIAEYCLAVWGGGADVLTGLIGTGAGLVSLVGALLKNPIDKLQVSAGNLAQLQITVLGYLDELEVLMANTPAADIDEAVKITAAIRAATRESLGLVEEFTENHPPSRQRRGSSLPETNLGAPPARTGPPAAAE